MGGGGGLVAYVARLFFIVMSYVPWFLIFGFDLME